MNRAPFLLRAISLVVDCVAGGLIWMMCVMLLSVTSADLNRQRLDEPILILIWLLYSATEIFFAATPGKMLLGLRIACQNGIPADFWRRLLRWSTKYFWLQCSLIAYLLPVPLLEIYGGIARGFIVIGTIAALNDDRLTWLDEWAGTAVWKRSRKIPPPLPAREIAAAIV